ncbi:MAG: hypothetical protein ACRD3W_07400, partial [Terriglobales bacterium]
SEKQWSAVSGMIYKSANKDVYWDMFVKDFVFQEGIKSGGAHAGQPLGKDIPSSTNPDDPRRGLNEHPVLIANFPHGPNGGAIRPSYEQTSIAAEIRFRRR